MSVLGPCILVRLVPGWWPTCRLPPPPTVRPTGPTAHRGKLLKHVGSCHWSWIRFPDFDPIWIRIQDYVINQFGERKKLLEAFEEKITTFIFFKKRREKFLGQFGLWMVNFCLQPYTVFLNSIFICVDPYSEHGFVSTKFRIQIGSGSTTLALTASFSDVFKNK